MTTDECVHPQANRRYYDSQHRDAYGRLLSSRRQVSCVLCARVLEDTTAEWDTKPVPAAITALTPDLGAETVNAIAERFSPAAEVAKERHPGRGT